MNIVLAAVALFAATAGFTSNNHPANARAAAACSTLFFDEGDLNEAKFFATLAREEDFTVPESIAANAQISMREGHWGMVALYQRSFPAASVAPPLPPRAIPTDAKQREARCRALAPPLFPEPFDAHSIGRDVEERIWQHGEKAITDTPPPCVDNSSFAIVVSSDGHVESVTMRRASFKAGGENDPAALAAEQQYMVPMLMKQKYKPGRIRGVPVRTITRAGVQRNCE